MATPNQCAMLQFMLENSKSSYAYSGINLLSYALSASWGHLWVHSSWIFKLNKGLVIIGIGS